MPFTQVVAATATPGFSTPLSARIRTERTRSLRTELEQRAFVFHRRLVDPALPLVDHIAIAPSGVWLIQREHVHCARVTVRHRLKRRPTLHIGGRDRTALVDPLDQALSAVRALLCDSPDAPIRTALVLPGAEFPLLRTLAIGDHAILRPAQLLAELDARGPLKRMRAREVAEALDARLG